MAYIYKKSSVKKTSFTVVFNSGSLFEKEGQYGTMHLMEHLICKTFIDEYDTLTANAVDWNAYTGHEHIVVYMRGLASRLTSDIKKRVLKKILGGLDNLTEEVFQKEKAVVIQEYMDNFNDPVSGKFLNWMRTHYGDYGPIGEISCIQNFTLEDVKKIYKEMLSKPARIIEVGPTSTDLSDMNIEYAEELIRQPRKIKYKKDYKLVQQEVLPMDKSAFLVHSKKLVSKSDYPFINVAVAMISDGLNSPLTQEIRVKRGLSYFSHGMVDHIWNDSILTFESCTTKENEEELTNVYNDLLNNVDKYLTKERYDMIMSMAQCEKEEMKLFRFAHVNDLINKGLPQMPNNLSKITFEKVKEVAKKYINPDCEIVILR